MVHHLLGLLGLLAFRTKSLSLDPALCLSIDLLACLGESNMSLNLVTMMGVYDYRYQMAHGLIFLKNMKLEEDIFHLTFNISDYNISNFITITIFPFTLC